MGRRVGECNLRLYESWEATQKQCVCVLKVIIKNSGFFCCNMIILSFVFRPLDIINTYADDRLIEFELTTDITDTS